MTNETHTRELFARTPVNGMLESRLVSKSAGRVEVCMAARPAMAQEYGIVQGGLISALADTAAVYLLIPEAMDHGQVHGIEFKMNFLRPAKADGSELSAVATPVKIGRKLAVCSVDVSQGGRLVARGMFTYLIDA